MDWFETGMTVYSLIINLFTVLNIWLLLTIFFGCELRLTRRNILISSGVFLVFDMAISLLFYSFEDHLSLLQVLLIYLFISVGACLLTKEKRFRTLLFVLPALLVYIMFSSVFAMLDTLLGLEKFALQYDEMILTPLEFLADFLIFAILMLVFRRCRRQKWLMTLTVGEGIGVLGFSLLFYALQIFFESISASTNDPYYQRFGYIVLILMNIVILYAVIHRKLVGYYKNESQNYKEQFEEEYSYFQTYRDEQEDTARFRHDWQNHMLVLQNMLKVGDYAKAEEYFAGLSGISGVPVQKILTGNEMLDMLLCMKENECMEEKIAVTMEGSLSELTVLRPIDSSILFSNLLDNAIEANRKVTAGRFIRIRARCVNESLYLEMENPMEGELQYEGSRLVTTKTNSEAHGFGLKNVEEIIKKYQGQYHIEVKEKRFTIQIMFPFALE